MPMKVLLFLIEGRKVRGLRVAGWLKCVAGLQMCVAVISCRSPLPCTRMLPSNVSGWCVAGKTKCAAGLQMCVAGLFDVFSVF